MASSQWKSVIYASICLISVLSVAPTCVAKDWYFDFTISLVNYTRNCVEKPLIAVNGLYPGPTIEIEEGDHVVVKVTNSGNQNVSIHWHGIHQIGSNWADGTAYITECPVKPGNYEIYDFHVTQQSGTTFWHAHVSWLRATVYGAFITKPASISYPFPKPDEEVPIILGEWWNADPESVEAAGLASGAGFALADALTINGFPGDRYNCSESEGLATIDVIPGKTYLLRIVNAALNTEMFFAIANHILTVVEVDSKYVKPFTVGDKGIVIAPGQTTNVLVTANQPPGTYYMVGQPHSRFFPILTSIPVAARPTILSDVPLIPTTGLFKYNCSPAGSSSYYYPAVPAINDTDYSNTFADSLRTLHPEMVPYSDNIRNLFYTVGTGTDPCTSQNPCLAVPSPGEVPGYRNTGQINNISFVSPTTAILPAYYFDIPGVYDPTFPDFPPHPYDYTADFTPPAPQQVSLKATRVAEFEYGSVIDLVMQDVNNFVFEDHPFHLHGHSFFVLGQGYGNYDGSKDPYNLNYYDPPSRFTVNVPARGWVAIRFKADNPGVWLLHCHLEKHLSWGMEVVFIVKNGAGPAQTLQGPTQRVNQC